MPINIHCPTCDQVVAAPDALAGKRVVCPNCKAVVAIPEKAAPAANGAKSADLDALQAIDVEPAPPLQIAKADVDQHGADEQAALRVVRIIYVMLRDDWRRLFTCAHLWPALFLFFLPFVNVSCNNRTLLSQSGLQACYGGFTVDPKVDQLARNEKALKNEAIPRPKQDEPAPWSILTIVYILFVFLGSGLGFLCILAVLFRFRLICAGLHLFSLGLGGAAFLALSAQMIIGFPIDKHVKQQFEKARAEQERRNAGAGIRPIQGAEGFEALFDIDSRYSPWLWLSCLLAFISAPAFLLEFSIVLASVVRGYLRKRVESG
jgi:phage FluMu protein Com